MHGGIVTVGFPTVLIGGPPASRIGDLHTCPLVTVLVPHVGGPFIMGAFTVLTGNMPQSKQFDTLVCVGPPDALAMGCPTVLIGMVGGGGLGGLIAGVVMAIGAMMDPYPRAVLQDDGTTVTEYNEFITVKGSPEYQAAVIQDLDTFTSRPTGQAWAERYEATGHHITIEPIPAGRNYDNSYCTNSADGMMRPDGTAGPGADSSVWYNPTRSTTYRGEDGNLHERTPDEVMGHELIHGLHNAEGTNRSNMPDPHGDNQEEAQTIGVHGYEDEPISERALVGEDGRPVRPDHDSLEESTYQDENGQWRHRYEDADGNRQRDPIDPPSDTGWRPSQ